MRVVPGMLEVADRQREALWEASAAMDRERRRRALDAAWSEYHRGQAERHRRTLEELIARHETEAEKLLEGEV